MNSPGEIWFCGVSFLLTIYGHADSLEETKAAFRAEYEKSRGTLRGAPR